MIISLIFLCFAITLFVGSIQPFGKRFATNRIASASANPQTQNFMPAINIANNGAILVSSARVVAVNDNKINMVVGWGNTNFEWVVQTDKTTKFIDTSGKYLNISNIQFGSEITVTGKLIDRGQGENPLIDAEFVRILPQN